MSQQPTFTIRPATIAASDHELFIDFRDSQIPWLSTIGSSAQWGTRSIRESNPSASTRARTWIERSEKKAPWRPNTSTDTTNTTNTNTSNTGNSGNDWCRAYVASTPTGTPVAGIILDSTSAAYVRAILPAQDEKDPFVYLAYLMSDRRVGEGERKGAAAALVRFARGVVGGEGVGRLCLDCWRGNGGRLVGYYESQGFKVLGDFTAEEKDWPGCVLEMRIDGAADTVAQ